MNPWLTIASVAIPEVVNLVKAIAALKKKYPAMTARRPASMCAGRAAKKP